MLRFRRADLMFLVGERMNSSREFVVRNQQLRRRLRRRKVLKRVRRRMQSSKKYAGKFPRFVARVLRRLNRRRSKLVVVVEGKRVKIRVHHRKRRKRRRRRKRAAVWRKLVSCWTKRTTKTTW